MGIADDTVFIQAAAKAAIQLQEHLLEQVSAACAWACWYAALVVRAWQER